MKKVFVGQIARDEKNVKFRPDDPYLLSYREFIAYFEDLKEITRHNLVIASYFTFGWMPEKLEFKIENFPSAIAILNEVRSGNIIEEKDLQLLKEMLYGSLVGTSKLLHFTNPHLYAILDKRVYKYINGENDHDQLNGPKNYLAFLGNCKELTSDEMFKHVHTSMNKKIGYEVTPYRAVELVMFMNGALD